MKILYKYIQLFGFVSLNTLFLISINGFNKAFAVETRHFPQSEPSLVSSDFIWTSLELGIPHLAVKQNSTPVQASSLNTLAQESLDQDRKAEADNLLQQGIQQFQNNQFQAAINSWRQALLIYREIDEPQGETSTLGNLGNLYRIQGQYVQAVNALQQVLDISRELDNQDSEAAALGSLGNVYIVQGEYGQAVDAFQQALTIFRELGNRQAEGAVLLGLGSAYFPQGQYQQAVEFFQESLTITHEVGDRSTEAQVLNNLGNAYFSLGNYLQATELFQQSLEVKRLLSDRLGEGNSLIGLGNIYRIQGQYQRANESFQQALAVFQELGASQGEANALNNLGSTSLFLGQYQQAIEQHLRALTIARESGDRQIEALALNGLGEAYRNQGQYRRALEAYQQSLAVAREISALQREVDALNNSGSVYILLRNYQRAEEFYQQALNITEEIGDRQGEAAAYGNLGLTASAQNQYSQAINFYRKSLSIQQEIGDRRGEAAVLGNLSEAYRAQGEYSEAIKLSEQALAISQTTDDRQGEAIQLANLGSIYLDSKQYQEADEFYEQSLAIARSIGDRNVEGTVLANTGILQEEQGNVDEAITLYVKAIDVVESIREDIRIEELKRTFASGQIDIYTRLINLLWSQRNFELAFHYVERTKARAFLDQLVGSRINYHADARFVEQQQALRDEIAALRNQLIVLNSLPQNQRDLEAIAAVQNQLVSHEVDYENLLTDIKIQSPATTALVAVNVVFLEEIQRLLEPDTTLVEYFVTGDRTFAFIITRTSFNAIPIEVSQDELTEQIQLFRDFADLDNVHPSELQQLHQWLIAPLKPYLTSENLIIVPHGVLHYLPFAALTDGDRYLNDDYVLSLLPSANTLRYLPQHHDSLATTLLVLGNPTVSSISDDFSLAPLPYAQSEVETIATLFNTQALVGNAATEDAVWVDAGKVNILHLAVHGTYNEDNPLFSTLHLASTSQRDGRLEVHEIYGLDLTTSTNLVVLSACQTNVGELSRGDEVVGMNRAFLYAGAPAVMSSLWNVDDAATGMLMEQFYTHFRTEMSAAEALRQAQQAVQADYPHPYFWAAFSVTGQ